MSRKHKHKHRPAGAPAASLPAKPGQGAVASASGLPREEPELIRELLTQGKAKPALERAKDYHKRTATPASEELLVEAYLARIRTLLESGMREEARAMADLALSRYEAARARKTEVELIFATHGSLDDLVRPLADPELPPPARVSVEEALRRTLADPGALARCTALPEEHPLRRAAATLTSALEAVTTRVVPDEELALPEISRRSPLAPWKMLVRALAAFYHNDDEASRRALDALEPDSAPARLAPALRAMLEPEARPGDLAPRAQALVRRVTGSLDELREALERLDHEYKNMRPGRVLRAIREAVAAARASAPELLEPLRQNIAVRTYLEGAPPEEIREAMGGPPVKNSGYWRLEALGWERTEARERYLLIICTDWEQFRRHAIAEGWFNPEGPEAVALYLHMAGVLGLHDPQHLVYERKEFIKQSERQGWLNNQFDGQPLAVHRVGCWERKPDTFFLDPDQLYARACALDPSAENYRLWLEWARRLGGNDWKDPERVARAWAAARPEDPGPLLELSAMAERRNALDKALKWLDQAMALDPLSPAVRRARLRLVAAAALRHLKLRKPHLVDKDLAQLEALPQAAEGDRPAFLEALRWLAGALSGAAPEAQEVRRAEIIRRLGSEAAAEVFLSGLASASGLKNVHTLGPPPGKELSKKVRSGLAKLTGGSSRRPELPEGESLAQAVGRALALGDELNLALAVPDTWEAELIKALTRPAPPVDPARLRTLAEAAMREKRLDLASAASGAGLALGGPDTARFMLLRARSITVLEFTRRSDAFLAAITLARRQRDTELVREAIDLLRNGERWNRYNYFADLDDAIADRSHQDLDPAHLERVLAAERGEIQRKGANFQPTYFADCPCLHCRIARGETQPPAVRRPGDASTFPAGPEPDDEDEDWDEDDEALDADLEAGLEELINQLGGKKPEVIELLMELLQKHVRPDGTLPSPDEIYRNDPELAHRLEELLGRTSFGGAGSGELPFDDFPPPRQNTKTHRKRRPRRGK